jgi:acyl dehydratase
VIGMSTTGPVRVLNATPRLSTLFGKAALTGLTRRGGDLPSTVYSQTGVSVDPDRLARYNEVCGFGAADPLPITYPHVLAFPLQVKLMTDREFPFPLIGSVHLANRITQHRPLRLGDRMDLSVWVEHLRPHTKGKQYDVISQATVDGEVVWRDVSTYLRRGGGTGESNETPRTATETSAPEPSETWQVPGDIGRRYGAVSGDRNPIHLYPLTAKLFGFSSAIAHGMWTKARCIAAYGDTLPDAFTVDVRFKLPVLLPAKVNFSTTGDADRREFTLVAARTGKPHVDGVLSIL